MMSKEAIEHYEAALKEAFPSGATGDVFYHWNEARKALAEQPAPVTELREQEPVAWVPYLSDRADGVKGHYAIARWNPLGYREVWNLRSHQWSAYSDDVLSLEEADALLRLITIPTRKVTSPPAQEFVCSTGLCHYKSQQQEPVAWKWENKETGKSGVYLENPEKFFDLSVASIYDWTPLYTSPPAQRTWVGLTDDERLEVAEIDGADEWFWKVCKAIEAKLKEKNT